ncbi:iron-containing redox enzyme family protein [Sphingoaurantiacus capsulatus]|uniref:Iron-containing redox enzyme family protein n=1 Tax=Sphingoaurantiacus capsulatus TaxID=1771310 RepID=A0ABV7X6T6_9SPHN
MYNDFPPRAANRASAIPAHVADPTGFHRRLSYFNRARLAVATPDADWQADMTHEVEMRRLEGEWIESERAAVADWAAQAPTDPDKFVEWFEALKANGPGQGDALFPWLAEDARRDEMKWFITQEVAGEAGFDDLVAMTQIKMPPRAKMELANNYWDEMGRGNIKGMHGPLLDALAVSLQIRPTIEATAWESLALANTMVAFATARRYAYHSIGALGVVELTAPGRTALVAKGLRRLGFSNKERLYFDLHAVLDIKHSEAWDAEVLWPLVSERPEAARYIAEGALMRLSCGARCFARYRSHLWGEPQREAAE